MDDVILMRRHPRTPLWKGYTFSPYTATPEELEFQVLRPNGTAIGEITFNEFSDKSMEVATPWGNFEVHGGRLSSKLSICRTGLQIADVSFNLMKTEVRLAISDGSSLTMRTRLSDFGYVCKAGSDVIGVTFEGAFTKDGINIKDLPRKQASAEWKDQKAPVRGYFEKPTDKNDRKATAPDPFYAQWRMTIPRSLKGNDNLIALVALLTCVRWLKVTEAPSSG